VRGPGAFQPCYEHPWSAESHTAAPLFLPGTIGEFFGDDRVPNSHDLMDKAAMQTLAMRGKFPLARGLAPPSSEIALAVFPFQALLPVSLDASLFIIVVGVVGTPLPVHLALETTNGAGIGCPTVSWPTVCLGL
jgi:hypothetical protein